MIHIQRNFFIIYGLIALVILLRLVPHPVNFTPMGALGLFAGAYLARKSAWLIPVVALAISDLFIGTYEPVAMLFVYLGFVSGAFLGHYLLKNRFNGLLLAGSSVAVSVLFFLLSNFGTWLAGTLYPLTLAGLAQCYIMALPFFGNTLASTLIYTFFLFTVIELLNHYLGRNRSITAV